MSSQREIPPLHEIAKLELKFKLFYFLRDLGIKSAEEPAREAWKIYANCLGDLTAGG